MKKVLVLVWTIYGVVATVGMFASLLRYHRFMRTIESDLDNDNDAT